jgi:hypothetical protein
VRKLGNLVLDREIYVYEVGTFSGLTLLASARARRLSPTAKSIDHVSEVPSLVHILDMHRRALLGLEDQLEQLLWVFRLFRDIVAAVVGLLWLLLPGGKLFSLWGRRGLDSFLRRVILEKVRCLDFGDLLR